MKKGIRVFILVIIITTMLMSTVLGAQVKKTIEVVYNSVNLTVNGTKVNADNILYEGTTYVPLRAVADALGKEVGWNQTTTTASINDKSNVVVDFMKNQKEKEDIAKLKLYSKITNHYKWLEDYGNILLSTDNNMSVAVNGMLVFNETETLWTTIGYFEQRIGVYNDLLDQTRAIILDAKNQGIDISDMNTIMNNYSKSIDDYKFAFQLLVLYSETKDSDDYEYSFNPRKSANELIYKQTNAALDKYFYYLNKIQSF